MTDCINTYSGTQFYPLEPRMEDFHIRDIAHALSLICRGNGQVKTFFSVGQHCIYCALEAKERGCSPRLQLACLLHDASEAYMSDVPRPFKQYLTQYKERENHLLELLYTKYLGSPLTQEEQTILKQIDDDLLYYDLLLLLNVKSPGPSPKLHITLSYEVRPFMEVEEQYLSIFQELTPGSCVLEEYLLS